MDMTTSSDDTRSRRRAARTTKVLAATIGVAIAAGSVTSSTSANAETSPSLAPHNPTGRFAVNVSGRRIHFYGTAHDVDATGPLTVAYYLNGRLRETHRTVASRYDRVWTRPYGINTVRVVARNVGLGTANKVLGSRMIRLINPATRNPRGSARITHRARFLRVRGIAFDPSRKRYPLLVKVFNNGRGIAIARANRVNHRYSVRARLHPGVNRIKVIGFNIGKGTANHVNGRATIRIGTWTGRYHGNRGIAARMLARFGWGKRQMPPLVKLWSRESGWRTRAANSSGAYGIPQALPGSKMRSAGRNWRTNAATQIRWGLGYIKGRYGSPARAWGHSRAHGWY
jgi:hypothetical protein